MLRVPRICQLTDDSDPWRLAAGKPREVYLVLESQNDACEKADASPSPFILQLAIKCFQRLELGRDQKRLWLEAPGVVASLVAGADARWSWLSLHAHYVRRRPELCRTCRNDRHIVCFFNITRIAQHHPWLGRRVGLGAMTTPSATPADQLLAPL